jgi:protein TonB
MLLHALPQGERTPSASALAPQQSLHVSLQPAVEAPRLTSARRVAAKGLPVPRYFAVEELDRRPLIQSHVEPHFPALALAPVGRIVLRLYVGDDGRVEQIAVESSDPTGAFEAAARQAFGAARFLPGLKDGVAVRSLVRIEVLFGSPHPDNG